MRGKIRLCEGQIARINGMTHNDPELLNQAVGKFNEASRLMPGSYDPYLGLARIYVYALKDIDKAYEALEHAQSLGFVLGNREKDQLADGYWARANNVFWDSRNVYGLPQERDQILRARDDFQRALGLYRAIVPWGTSKDQVSNVETSLRSVETRLKEIDSANDAAAPAVKSTAKSAKPILRLIERLFKL